MQQTERPVQTRFRCAYTYRLKLACYTKSLTHYTKGTQSAFRPSTVCRHPVSGSISLPSSGCFSPFPHGTGSLSVMHEYLGLESGLPMFRQDFTCPALLKDTECSTSTGLSPIYARLSILFDFIPRCHWPGPRSLATTNGVSVDVLSCRYLDVSVPCVRFLHPIFSGADTSSQCLEPRPSEDGPDCQASEVGSPIRRSMDQSLFAAPHGLSQRITSFFACACLGIHQMPF